MTVIRCIRHGQSASNAGEVTEYPDTIPLTGLGHASYGSDPEIAALFEKAADVVANAALAATA